MTENGGNKHSAIYGNRPGSLQKDPLSHSVMEQPRATVHLKAALFLQANVGCVCVCGGGGEALTSEQAESSHYDLSVNS